MESGDPLNRLSSTGCAREVSDVATDTLGIESFQLGQEGFRRVDYTLALIE